MSGPEVDPLEELAAYASNGRSGSEAAGQGWRGHLICGDRGPRALLANAITALRYAPEWVGVLGYDEFSLKTVALMPAPWEAGTNDWRSRDWKPRDDGLATDWLQHRGIHVGFEVAQKAIEIVAQDRPVHPVRDYLNGLQWDEQARVDQWATKYLGVEASPYVNAVGRRWLLSAVARVMRPGCKADHMLVLEGSQGRLKSTALGVLAGDEWFADEVGDIGNKDAAIQIAGKWLVEFSELDALSKHEATRVKAFISRTTDRYRPPWGRRAIDAPHQCVFAGTTNKDDYLKDETGGRRFWPIRVTSIDIDALRKDRDQLWAEAMHLWRSGAHWWLDDEKLTDEAMEEQAERYQGDPWEEDIASYVENLSDVSMKEILGACLGLEKARWGQVEQNRVSRCLRVLGFRKYRPQRKEDPKRTPRYRRN